MCEMEGLACQTQASLELCIAKEVEEQLCEHTQVKQWLDSGTSLQWVYQGHLDKQDAFCNCRVCVLAVEMAGT